jgi:hypothetical protein
VRRDDQLFSDAVFGVKDNLIGVVPDQESNTISNGFAISHEDIVPRLLIVEEVVNSAFLFDGGVEAVGVEFEVRGEGVQVGVVASSNDCGVIKFFVYFDQLEDLV